jgi:hypothetical protein
MKIWVSVVVMTFMALGVASGRADSPQFWSETTTADPGYQGHLEVPLDLPAKGDQSLKGMFGFTGGYAYCFQKNGDIKDWYSKSSDQRIFATNLKFAV